MNKDWIKETNELLEDWEAEKEELHSKYEQLANELMDLEQRIATGHELISAYIRKHKIDISAPNNINLGNLGNKSYPDMVIEIAKQSNGILKVSDVADILFEAKVGGDIKAIRHNVGNALLRSPYFTKIGRGQYRFTNHVQSKETKRSNKKTGHRIRVKSGVQEAVKELKDKNPQMTRKEVLNHLITTGFDFKGKKPDPAVRFVWAKLGYAKENKQQPLPIGASMTVPINHVNAVPLVSNN